MPASRERLERAFGPGHAVLPVVHVVGSEQARRNVQRAFEAGANGVFLINHALGSAELLAVHQEVAESWPGRWLGVNCLDLDPVAAVCRAGPAVAGIWVDNAMIEEGAQEQERAEAVLDAIRQTGWRGLYFGGVAFKYQRPVADLSAAARIAAGYMDVVTTSGPGTGYAADIDKIAAMKAAMGDAPLAIASGIAPENVRDYLPISDCYLVATGVSSSFEELDPRRLQTLVSRVREWDALGLP